MLEEKKAAEQKMLEEKKRQQAIEQEKQRQAELKRKKEAEKEKQHQVELKRKKEAEQKRLSEEKHRKAEEKRLLQAEMQAESARLAGAMEAEEAAMSAARRGSMIKQWENAIRLRVRSKWLEPPGGASGKCKVEVTQARTGTVLDVYVVPSTSCNASMQDSVLRAVKRADPLPRPKDPSIFDSQIHFTFDPEQ
jgi:colicin import membrane protein